MKPQVYCSSCDWQGRIIDLVSFPKGTKQLCPNCGEQDSICDCDDVDFNSEYEKQERIDVPKY